MQNIETGIASKNATKQLHVSAEVHCEIRIMALRQGVTVNDIVKELIRKNNEQKS
ncbi:hypothetical protein [Kamptonema sp. UHCC 0994]|uniref:hypothetical protein n=1 Tax=Kamptonema sp. UHCC 0994 TaxID=3031329 RepID=UPI0023B9205C|nr:hypothetical protein [Kamptonema sp. UHCC 0994]MDF0553875.1 hypothetical protein [Kamptonema sp. UHCC 0994]